MPDQREGTDAERCPSCRSTNREIRIPYYTGGSGDGIPCTDPWHDSKPTCPTCKSDDPVMDLTFHSGQISRREIEEDHRCPDPFHNPTDEGDTGTSITGDRWDEPPPYTLTQPEGDTDGLSGATHPTDESPGGPAESDPNHDYWQARAESAEAERDAAIARAEEAEIDRDWLHEQTRLRPDDARAKLYALTRALDQFDERINSPVRRGEATDDHSLWVRLSQHCHDFIGEARAALAALLSTDSEEG